MANTNKKRNIFKIIIVRSVNMHAVVKGSKESGSTYTVHICLVQQSGKSSLTAMINLLKNAHTGFNNLD